MTTQARVCHKYAPVLHVWLIHTAHSCLSNVANWDWCAVRCSSSNPPTKMQAIMTRAMTSIVMICFEQYLFQLCTSVAVCVCLFYPIHSGLRALHQKVYSICGRIRRGRRKDKNQTALLSALLTGYCGFSFFLHHVPSGKLAVVTKLIIEKRVRSSLSVVAFRVELRLPTKYQINFLCPPKKTISNARCIIGICNAR